MKAKNTSIYKTTKFWEKYGKVSIYYENLRKSLVDQGMIKQAYATYFKQKIFFPGKNTTEFWDREFSLRSKPFPMEDWREKVVMNLLHDNLTLLNIGVGSGRLENKLFEKGKYSHYIGTDITSTTLNGLRKKFPDKKFLKSRVEQLPFEGQSFDQVLLLEVLEHIKPHKTFGVLREVYRVLKKDGTFVISIPVNEGLENMLPYNPNAHMRIYSEDLIIFELVHSGFKVKKIYKTSAFSNFFWVKNLLNNIFSFRHSNNLILVCTK